MGAPKLKGVTKRGDNYRVTIKFDTGSGSCTIKPGASESEIKRKLTDLYEEYTDQKPSTTMVNKVLAKTRVVATVKSTGRRRRSTRKRRRTKRRTPGKVVPRRKQLAKVDVPWILQRWMACRTGREDAAQAALNELVARSKEINTLLQNPKAKKEWLAQLFMVIGFVSAEEAKVRKSTTSKFSEYLLKRLTDGNDSLDDMKAYGPLQRYVEGMVKLRVTKNPLTLFKGNYAAKRLQYVERAIRKYFISRMKQTKEYGQELTTIGFKSTSDLATVSIAAALMIRRVKQGLRRRQQDIPLYVPKGTAAATVVRKPPEIKLTPFETQLVSNLKDSMSAGTSDVIAKSSINWMYTNWSKITDYLNKNKKKATVLIFKTLMKQPKFMSYIRELAGNARDGGMYKYLQTKQLDVKNVKRLHDARLIIRAYIRKVSSRSEALRRELSGIDAQQKMNGHTLDVKTLLALALTLRRETARGTINEWQKPRKRIRMPARRTEPQPVEKEEPQKASPIKF